jgi:hypothetical protein
MACGRVVDHVGGTCNGNSVGTGARGARGGIAYNRATGGDSNRSEGVAADIVASHRAARADINPVSAIVAHIIAGHYPSSLNRDKAEIGRGCPSRSP